MKLFNEWWINARHDWDRRTLSSNLAEVIDKMEGHKAVDLPAGHEYYKLLLKQANAVIGTYCNRYQISYDDVAVGVPKVRELRTLADGVPESGRIASVGFIAIIGSVAATVLAAGCHNLYLYLTHWVH